MSSPTSPIFGSRLQRLEWSFVQARTTTGSELLWFSQKYALQLESYDNRTLLFVLLAPVYSTLPGQQRPRLPTKYFFHPTRDFYDNQAREFLASLNDTGFGCRNIVLLPGIPCDDGPIETRSVIDEIQEQLDVLHRVRTDSQTLKAEREKGKGRPEELPMNASDFVFHFPRMYLDTMPPHGEEEPSEESVARNVPIHGASFPLDSIPEEEANLLAHEEINGSSPPVDRDASHGVSDFDSSGYRAQSEDSTDSDTENSDLRHEFEQATSTSSEESMSTGYSDVSDLPSDISQTSPDEAEGAQSPKESDDGDSVDSPRPQPDRSAKNNERKGPSLPTDRNQSKWWLPSTETVLKAGFGALALGVLSYCLVKPYLQRA